MSDNVQGSIGATPLPLDAIIIGAGFGGIYMVHQLANKLGLRVRLFDRAAGVGGTWYWNRYPGARSDVESYVYSYSFDPALRDEWDWQDRYPKQEEILAYLNHVTDRYDLRRHMQLSTAVVSAKFDEAANVWHVVTDSGETLVSRFLITALGSLSATNFPNIPGSESFLGESFHTAKWPTSGVDFKNKRVGVIGTGSTGIQTITAIAPECGHLTVFQRTPQYSVPARYGPMPPEFIAAVKKDYDNIWRKMRETFIAAGFEESATSYHDVTEEERQAKFEAAWDRGGGFRFMFGAFNDIATDYEANEGAARFIRSKIASIVKNPETARALTPTDLYARRPVCDMGYYDTFNRPNVTLVDIKAAPIVEFTKTGIRTTAAEYDLDILIYATGFEAVDGSYLRMEIIGAGGQTIQDKWKNGASSFIGITTSGFPNMFMILGSNTVFANIPPVIEAQVEWIAETIKTANAHGRTRVEVTDGAVRDWVHACTEGSDATLFSKLDTWIYGCNIPGKPKTVMFYMSGLANYRRVLAELVANDYDGLLFDKQPLKQTSDSPEALADS